MNITVYVNKHDRRGNVIGRKKVSATLLEERRHSVLVRIICTGKVVVRKKNRDLPERENQSVGAACLTT